MESELHSKKGATMDLLPRSRLVSILWWYALKVLRDSGVDKHMVSRDVRGEIVLQEST